MVKLFTQRLISTFQMKLFYHPLPPLSKQALIVIGLTLDMDMNKGLEPGLYFVIKAFVHIHLNNNKVFSINKYMLFMMLIPTRLIKEKQISDEKCSDLCHYDYTDNYKKVMVTPTILPCFMMAIV